jgi:hydrogenase maturation protease
LTQVLVIGYGNTLAGDDGVGCLVADTLACRPWRDGVQIVTAYQLYPEMAEQISTVERLIFVDARVDGVPGDIHEEAVVSPTADSQAFTHHLTPSQLLWMAQTLYGRSPESARLVTITGQNFDLGVGLSPLIAERLPDLLARVKALMA